MAGEQHSVGEDIVRTEVAIVSDVATGHEEIFVADDRVLLEFGGSMNRDVFAKDIAMTDAQAGWGSGVFKILGRIADDSSGVELVSVADGGVSGEIDVWADDAAGAEDHMRVDHGVGPDDASGADFCVRMHRSEGVDPGSGVGGKFGREGSHEWK